MPTPRQNTYFECIHMKTQRCNNVKAILKTGFNKAVNIRFGKENQTLVQHAHYPSLMWKRETVEDICI